MERFEFGAALSPGAAAEILATHNGASEVGAALAVAVSGIASMCTQLEGLAGSVGAVFDADSIAEDARAISQQGRAFLNRVGHMVGPKPGDMIEGRDSLVHPHPSDSAPAPDLRAVLEDARGKLGVVARFILDGEEMPGEEGATCEMSIDDAYDTAQLAVEAVRAVCADIDKALGGAPAPRALEDIAADNLRGRAPEALALLGDLLALGRERELAFKENDGPLLRLCIRAADICGASGWFHSVGAAPAWDGVERRKGARRTVAKIPAVDRREGSPPVYVERRRPKPDEWKREIQGEPMTRSGEDRRKFDAVTAPAASGDGARVYQRPQGGWMPDQRKAERRAEWTPEDEGNGARRGVDRRKGGAQ